MKQRKKLVILLACVMVIAAFLGGCGTATPTDENDETISFTDSCGRTVELPADIQRIAPSGAVAQMVLYTLVPDRLVGYSARPTDAQLQYLTAFGADLPEFGQFYGKASASLNLEAVIAADPQVIIDIGNMKDSHKEDMDGVQQQTGVATIFIEADLDTFADAYRTLGELLGCEERANAIADYIEETLAMADEIEAQLPEEQRVSVMFGTGENGLNVNARGSIHADVIDRVGGINAIVVDEVSSKGGGNTINAEELLNADPQVIILSAEGGYSYALTDEAYAQTRAAQEGRIYEIPSLPYSFMADPPSINRIIGIRWLGNLLYSQLYDLDMVQELQRFYELFWHYDLSEEEAKTLLANSTYKEQAE